MRTFTYPLALSLGVGCLTAADLASNVPGSREDDWFSWLVYAVSFAGLLAHRVRPGVSAAVTGAGCVAWTLHGHLGELLNLPAMVALYFVALGGDRRRTVRVAVFAALVAGAAAVISGQEAGRPVPSPVLEMAVPLVPLLLGEVVRGRRELARHALVEREREAERRVRAERMRIARELHDIVAHTVSAMTVHAGVALEALDRRPEVARTALRQVRESGREAVAELRATVRVLREADAAVPVDPAPGLDQLSELVERLSGGGLRVTLRRSGAGGALPPMVGLAAYRIVQEALTNVVKHSAARHAAVSVVDKEDGRLTVEVLDEGPSRPGAAGPPGFGLLGMRERAAAVGGTLDHGPHPAGGFRVRASLPTAERARVAEEVTP
ncbi:sensor histidine kinase [Streptomyces sp. 8K308]|uniref:sensor histidine kinase n=1 Tax=Streptomyces sp. 8K308 TaxID=2530388 RepID=UPI001FB58375|nr:sensor histidine kinase [Streptomyces sp. 8K308]